MITKINLNNVASYKNIATLVTDKKVNLIYGLNGTGKSTLSNYLYNRSNPDYLSCSIEGITNEDILVYNQTFIHDYFYVTDDIKGVFTLSKENKAVEEKIKNAQSKITKLETEMSTLSNTILSIQEELLQKKQNAETIIWGIKTDYVGGDRVLVYCLDGLKGSKETLYNYINALAKPETKPQKTIDDLKSEVALLNGENARRYESIPTITINVKAIETDLIFQKEIIGNKSSSVAGLINKLNNADWIKQGLKYLPENFGVNNSMCPFCQEKTISNKVISNIKEYFDESYEKDVTKLNTLALSYKSLIESIQSFDTYNSNPFVLENNVEFTNTHKRVLTELNINLKRIEGKLNNLSQKINLNDSKYAIDAYNNIIDKINLKITAHNRNIDDKEAALQQIKKTFWNIMRWDYDQTISGYTRDKKYCTENNNKILDEVHSFEALIKVQTDIISDQYKNTVNIDESIVAINNGLVDLGIDNIRIKKHSNNLYKIDRDGQEDDTFKTLSEGEKMVISFLYFLELCKGKKSATDTVQKKIVVIDDPISSLSHIYVFNIGRLIKNVLLRSNTYEQVFVLTHSLYFFYELTDTNHGDRKVTQKLFRMYKNCNGSHITEMKYEEIQNDYHSYWHIIKDKQQSPALIANCMRNIIEYFFNFIEKKDLSNVMNIPVLQDTKYQAFWRYINRESHSLGQNIFDIKEFDYEAFKDAFRLVFECCGYNKHYEKMMKL